MQKIQKIAVFHNFMDNIGGAEIVTLHIARAFNADIYTTNIDKEHIAQMGFSDVLPRIFSIGRIPIQAPFRQQYAFLKFRYLNLKSKYDFFIISGDWAMSAAVHHTPNLWYIHSPLHELWEYAEKNKEKLVSWWQLPFYIIWVYINRKLSLHYSKSVQTFICNSKNTQSRIKKYYSVDAEIVYPPTNISLYKNTRKNTDILSVPTETKTSGTEPYWLSVNRLSYNKRIEMQIEAFKKLPNEKLIIVGSYEKGARHFEQYKNFITENLGPNTTLLNWISQEKLVELYAGATGFITTAETEDFGMTAIEAMAAGKPVIAPNEGGYTETVIDGETGILIDTIDSIKIVDAISSIKSTLDKNSQHYTQSCIEQAKKFDVQIFIEKMRAYIYRLES